MSVTLLEVLAAAQARRASLVGEMAGYLVLGVSDQVASAPRRIGAECETNRIRHDPLKERHMRGARENARAAALSASRLRGRPGEAARSPATRAGEPRGPAPWNRDQG